MELHLAKAHATLAADKEMTVSDQSIKMFPIKVHWIANTKLVLYFKC